MAFARHGLDMVLVAGLFFSASSYAEKLRVTTWNLQSATSAPSNGILTNNLESVAAALKQIDPDVVLLQQVSDWKMCSQLAQLLKPSIYEVLICSAFPETAFTGKRNRQAAILSKRKAYFSWSEGWGSSQPGNTLSGGFAFAAIQTADHRVGLFSVELDGAANGRLPQQEQWGRQIQSIRKWVTNRPESAVVAARLLEAEKTALKNKGNDNYIDKLLSQPLALAPMASNGKNPLLMPKNTEALPAVLLTEFPQTYELDLELADEAMLASQASLASVADAAVGTQKIKDEPFSKPIESAGGETASQSPEGNFANAFFHSPMLWLALTPIAIFLLGIFVWLLARRENRSQMRPRTPAALEISAGSGDSVLVTSQSITGSIIEQSDAPSVSQPVIQQLQVWQQRALAAEQKVEKANDAIRDGLMTYLAEWLKQKLFRKLIADRAQLLESQQVATVRALAVDERLSRLEVQIQQQNQAYEQRIERLTQELAVTKEESRALIRAQITQIKSEMEAARARLVAERQIA